VAESDGLHQVTEQEGTIQLFAAATCPKVDILLEQIAELYLVAQYHNLMQS